MKAGGYVVDTSRPVDISNGRRRVVVISIEKVTETLDIEVVEPPGVPRDVGAGRVADILD